MTQSESITSIATALNLFQRDIAGVKKTSENPFYKSMYADLGSIWEAIRELLTTNGLSVTQVCEGSTVIGDTVTIKPEFETHTPLVAVSVTTMLMHVSGEFISGTISLPITKNDPQGVGSAITYARRYALASILGIHQEDDDANSQVDTGSKHDSKLSVNGLLTMLANTDVDDTERKLLADTIRDAKNDTEKLAELFAILKSKPVKGSGADSNVKQELIDLITHMMNNNIYGFAQKNKRDNSILKHLGCSVSDCQDVDKMRQYINHLKEKGANND